MHDENCGFRLSGGTRPCFFPVPALLFPCYLAPVFARKAIQIRALPEKAGEKTPNIRRNLPFPPAALRPKAADCGGLSARFAANPLHLQQNGHRPPANRRPLPHNRAGAGSVWLQIRCKCSQTLIASRARPGSGANQWHAMSRGRFSCAMGICPPARCIGSRARRSR